MRLDAKGLVLTQFEQAALAEAKRAHTWMEEGPRFVDHLNRALRNADRCRICRKKGSDTLAEAPGTNYHRPDEQQLRPYHKDCQREALNRPVLAGQLKGMHP